MNRNIITEQDAARMAANSRFAGLAGLQRECFRIAEEHGFHEGRTPDRALMLLVSELAEIYEAVRRGHRMDEWWYVCRSCATPWDPEDRPRLSDGVACCGAVDLKPDGPAVEWADVLIRLLDTTAEFGVPLAEATSVKLDYNDSRPYKHGRAF